MSNLKITLKINREAALKAGIAEFGDREFPLTQELLDRLTQQSRDLLVLLIENDISGFKSVTVRGDSLYFFDIKNAMKAEGGQLDGLAEGLFNFNNELTEKRKKAEVLRNKILVQLDTGGAAALVEKDVWGLVHKYDFKIFKRALIDWQKDDCLLAAYNAADDLIKTDREKRKAEQQAEKEALAKAQERIKREANQEHEVREKAKEAWLLEHGTPNQLERFKRGLLPDCELRNALRDFLFKAAVDLGYMYITTLDFGFFKVPHTDYCEVTGEEFTPEFAFDPKTTISDKEFEALKAFEKLFPKAEVGIGVAWGYCSECNGGDNDDELHIDVLRVAIEWHGEELYRFYRLSDDREGTKSDR